MSMLILEVKPNGEAEITVQCNQCTTPPRSGYLRSKRFLDQTLALLMLIPGLPLIAILVALVRLSSRGPGIYRQIRVGRGGKTFTMYKIRTMRKDAETRTGAVWTQTNDPRITRLGWFLRKIHLDELPQLFNVLRGDMSLVGPRPERPEFVRVLVDQIPGYADRLTVLPGVTGLSQINLPPDTDLNSVRRKQFLDLEYIQTAGLWLDLRMMACTSLRLVGISGSRATRLTFVERKVPPIIADDDEDTRVIREMTPTALSESLTSKLAAFGESLAEDQLGLRDQVHQLLATTGNGHGKEHGNDHGHTHGNGNGRRGGVSHVAGELAARKPKPK